MTTNTSAQNTRCYDFNQHAQGLALCHRVTWTLWHTGGSRQDTHGTPVPEREGRGWPDTSSTTRQTTNDNTTKDRFESNVLSGNKW